MKAWSVLIVDDVKHWRELLAFLLETDARFGIAGVAEDGEVAIRQVLDHCPDAIVLDVQMPHMGGLEALPHLRGRCPDSVIVMWSSDPAAASMAEQAGANAVVDKSHGPAAVLDRLADLCQDPPH